MKRVLYIEDDKDISEAVRLMLEGAGFEAETACSGKEGIKKAEKKFDLILLDIMLPDMSGWDIFAKLREKTKAKFAFLSALPITQRRMEELREVGVSDYITKPFAKNDLLQRIKGIIMKKVLYVEDDKDTAEAVKLILTNAGFETETAYSGAECLKRINEEFDLILLDMMLPDMSGWDIFEVFNNKINSKFAFLSAVEANEKRKEELQKAGVADYITKPFIKEDLIGRISKILNQKQVENGKNTLY
jgi:two-component system, OmpR family, response regulator VicR